MGPVALPTGTGAPPLFGQISAVAKGHDNDIWVFHRGAVVWDLDTFSPEDGGQHVKDPRAFVAAAAVVRLQQVYTLRAGLTGAAPNRSSLVVHAVRCCVVCRKRDMCSWNAFTLGTKKASTTGQGEDCI